MWSFKWLKKYHWTYPHKLAFGAYPFQVFKTLDPVPKNNDNGHKMKITMTSIVPLIMGSMCIMVFFIDTIQVW